jgi:endonuclease I
MKITYSLLFAFYYSFCFAQAGSPDSSYYSGFNFIQNGTDLKNDLSSKVITTHSHLLTYQEAEEAIKVVDIDPEDFSNQNVLLVYGFSSNICPDNPADFPDHRRRYYDADGTSSCQWNREHTYPKSLGNPDLGTDGPGADVHHLRASDVNRNANRGNLKYGPGTGNSQNSNGFWYPGDEWKGDVARMMMYMYMRYGEQCLPINVGTGTILDTDPNMIDLFLQWNAEDPVSEIEDRRNTYIEDTANNYYAQGNRNPFIDNPYLATKIWGGIAAENRWPGIFLNANTFDLSNSVAIYPNPTINHRINISSDNTIDTIQLININGQLIQKIQNPVEVDHSYTLENLPQGFYFIKLTSNSQTLTKKIIVN